MKNSYRFFSNKECEYFPCHRVADPDKFNCMFCYCPLYALGDSCGGNFKYVGADEKIKDCSSCMIPHSENAHDHIISMFNEVAELAAKNRK